MAQAKPAKARRKPSTRRAPKAIEPAQEADLAQADAEHPELFALNWKQRLFVHYYLTQSQGNATDAARRAGYLDPEVASFRLKQSKAVRAALSSHADALGMTTEEILSRLADIASLDVGDCLDESGNVDVSKLKAKGKTHLIQGITPTANGLAIKFHSPVEGLTLLGKFRKLWVERISLEDFDPSKLSVEQLQAIVAKGRG